MIPANTNRNTEGEGRRELEREEELTPRKKTRICHLLETEVWEVEAPHLQNPQHGGLGVLQYVVEVVVVVDCHLQC